MLRTTRTKKRRRVGLRNDDDDNNCIEYILQSCFVDISSSVSRGTITTERTDHSTQRTCSVLLRFLTSEDRRLKCDADDDDHDNK